MKKTGFAVRLLSGAATLFFICLLAAVYLTPAALPIAAGNEIPRHITLLWTLLLWMEGAAGALIMLGSFLAALVCFFAAGLMRAGRRGRAVTGLLLLSTALSCFAARAAAAYSYNDDSPVSLLIDNRAEKIGIRASIVRFPLDLRHPDSWYTWRASSAAPLLVYDPSRSGKIVSATQLFGKWSFGGKFGPGFSTVSLTVDQALAAEPWDHGFQPLSLLDVNEDNKLSGRELAPLSLWFDENQDAVSQPGEVRSLASEGIVTLYFRPDYTDQAENAMYVRCGYERILKGKKVCGTSVDWFSSRGQSKQELALMELF